jgi:hypothetical protein
MDTALVSRTLDAKPIAPALFPHFVLRWANMPAMAEWYTTVLNMRLDLFGMRQIAVASNGSEYHVQTR